MTWQELECRYDTRKSFYGKAHYEIYGAWGQNVRLKSYDTVVAMIGYIATERANELGIDEDAMVCELLPYWDCSQTTTRHVKEFLRQWGFGTWTVSEIRKHAHAIEDGCYLIERP